MTGKKKTKSRGTDEPFLSLMSIGGPAVLKLLGVPPEEAEEYTFRSVVLKEKRMEPDTEALPMLENRGKRVYIEFQGYTDKFIRYKLVSRITLACAQDKYKDRVLAGIVYTDEAFKKAALQVNAFSGKIGEELEKTFVEIVLTDYAETRLMEIDPRLIVLAPFTVSPKESKTELISRGRKWKQKINQIYTGQSVRDALNIIGLLILNRFRNITREEVIVMLNFDLKDTVAGQQIFDAGALENARLMVIEVLKERFIAVPHEIKEAVNSVGKHEMLKKILRYAVRSPDMEDFNKTLTKVLSALKPEKKTEITG